MVMFVEVYIVERWGLVNCVVVFLEFMWIVIIIVEVIFKNNEGFVVKYKIVINDGFKFFFGEVLKFE